MYRGFDNYLPFQASTGNFETCLLWIRGATVINFLRDGKECFSVVIEEGKNGLVI